LELERIRKAEQRKRDEDSAQRHQDSANVNRTLIRILLQLKADSRRKSQAKRWHFGMPSADTARQWLTVVFVAIAAVFAARQWKAMTTQVDEMQSEQRAWVALSKDSGILSLSVNDANEIRSAIRIGLENSGRNPAVEVFANAEISIGTQIPHGSMPAWQKAVCEQPTSGLGYTVFPNSIEPSLTIDIGTKPDELVALKRLSSNPGGTPVVAACIVYRDAVTNLKHYTPLAFQILNGVPKPGEGCCAIAFKDLPISGKDLVLRIWVLGSMSIT